MRVTNQYIWHLIFFLFFLVLVWLGIEVLEEIAYRPVQTVTFADVILIILASFRVIRLVVYDKIMGFFREQFWDVSYVNGDEVVLTKPSRGPRRAVAELISCPWCFGLWAAAVTTFFYFLTPYTFYLVFFLAIAAVATLLQLIANVIGWKAENLKRSTESTYKDPDIRGSSGGTCG